MRDMQKREREKVWVKGYEIHSSAFAPMSLWKWRRRKTFAQAGHEELRWGGGGFKRVVGELEKLKVLCQVDIFEFPFSHSTASPTHIHTHIVIDLISDKDYIDFK